MTRWLPFAIALAALCLALWIVVPGPTYFFLRFAVGAPEVSAWLIAASIVAILLGAAGARESAIARAAVACGSAALILSSLPWLRLPGTIRAFDAAVKPVSAEPASPRRTSRVSLADLVRGIPRTPATVRTVVGYAAPAGVPLSLEIYTPERAGRFPVVVQIYGGAWQRGTPADFANFATWLANAGYVVFAIDYRHAPAYRWREQLADVDSGLAWIRDHAADYGGDTARVVLLGRSAGAHLAMLSAYTAPPIRVRGVVSLYGPADLVDAYRHPPRPDPLHIRDVEEAFIGGPPDQRLDEYVAASPIAHATRPLPPTLLIYGARDHIVEARYGRALHDRLVASGTPAAYLEIPWAEHAFDEVFNGPSSQLALYYIERFLAWSTT